MIRIGLLGLGTVGSAVLRLLPKYFSSDMVQITKILVNNLSKPRDGVNLENRELTDDPMAIIASPDIDLVVELIGGQTPALEYILMALNNHKSVVTANKTVLALHGNKIFATSLKNNIPLGWEASVGGGIPIIRSLINSFNYNKVTKFIAICNGTSNYILSQMSQEKISFNQALEQAQKLGFAEADPSLDIDGFDSACKCSLLAVLVFKINPAFNLNQCSFNKITCEGIANITIEDITYSDRLDYVIKPIIYGVLLPNNKILLATFPALIKKDNLIADINGAENIFQLHSELLTTNNYTGPGAGGDATAASILADISNIINNPRLDLDFYSNLTNKYNFFNISEYKFRFFISLKIINNSENLIPEIIKLCANFNVSIEKYFSENFTIILLTNDILNSVMQSLSIKLLQHNSITSCKYIRVL